MKLGSVLKLLIADDDPEIASLYSKLLSQRGHKVVITRNGELCLKIYGKRFEEVLLKRPASYLQPFDTVILDYKLPDRNGFEIAKEILATNPHQRIIFVSAYVRKTLSDSVKKLELPVELLQKPVPNKALVDTIEDKEIYEELKRLKFDVQTMKKADFSHEQLMKFLTLLKIVLDKKRPNYR
jgi:CheY-like chemotaxis protein